VTESTATTLKPREPGTRTAFHELSQAAARHADQLDHGQHQEQEPKDTRVSLAYKVTVESIKRYGRLRQVRFLALAA
jgi:hypothetical protein